MELSYVSLFSSAGIGCYGFKMNGYKCVATNELLPGRMKIQRANHKCGNESGYIVGDITNPDIKARILEEVNNHGGRIDVLFATPPCQGMSSINLKKNDHEQVRNSLVVEAIKMVLDIRPRFFVFENVRSFMTSICTDISGGDIVIEDAIHKNLGEHYDIAWEVINFKDYGIPSSRPRTLVIGMSREIGTDPRSLFPGRRDEITLRESIGDLPRLAYGEKDTNDFLHFARKFPEHQVEWIHDLGEGESAFDKPRERWPYTFDKDGNRREMKGSAIHSKYRRLIWDKPCACVTTRNDVLSSQNTIHPCDDRVLSIRELMRVMTIPDSFRWTTDQDDVTPETSTPWLRRNEMNIRHCIGEAVPTNIMYEISGKIKETME